MLDALDGEGGAFWEQYAGRVLPQPASLSVPFCLPPRLLDELQHQEIIIGAAKQQVLSPPRIAGGSRCYALMSIAYKTVAQQSPYQGLAQIKPFAYQGRRTCWQHLSLP